MHELSIIESVLGTVEAVARENGARAVTAIRIQVGPLAGVVPELLDSAFQAARQGTLAESAVLTIEIPAVRVRCRACGAESEPAGSDLVCPACASAGAEIVRGTELTLMSVELEADGTDDAGPPASA